MRRRSTFGDRHPRWIAGLWFAIFLVASRLIYTFVLGWSASRVVANAGLPGSQLPIHAGLALVAGCIGARLGSGLLAPGVEPAEVVRRGAWIGLSTGLVFTPLGAIAQWLASPERPQEQAWPAATLLLIQTCFLAGWLLPVGALAAWCFVRIGGPTERSAA